MRCVLLFVGIGLGALLTYVSFTHEPDDRGLKYRLDAWTGLLHSEWMEVPELKSW